MKGMLNSYFFITQSINRDAALVNISHLPTPIQ